MPGAAPRSGQPQPVSLLGRIHAGRPHRAWFDMAPHRRVLELNRLRLGLLAPPEHLLRLAHLG
eukprot:scaffold33337_cov42-Phaeocystis_antarctica.AAC.1